MTVVNLGAGSGIGAANILGGVQQGLGIAEQRKKDARQARMDEERIRGAGVRTDAVQQDMNQSEQLFPEQLRGVQLGNTGLEQGIESKGYELENEAELARLRRENKDLLERVYTTTQQNTAGANEAAIEQRPSMTQEAIATAERNTAQAERDRQEAIRETGVNQQTAGIRSETDVLNSTTENLEAKDEKIIATNTHNRLPDKLTNDNANEDAEIADDEIDRDAKFIFRVYNQAALNPTEAGTALRNHPDYGNPNIHSVKVDDNYNMRAFDKQGNQVVDKDGDGEPDPEAFALNIAELPPDMLKEHSPELYKKLYPTGGRELNPKAMAEVLNMEVDTVIEEVSKHMQVYDNVQIDPETGNLLNATAKQQEEYQAILAEAQKLMVVHKIPLGMAIKEAVKHPQMLEQFAQLGVRESQVMAYVDDAFAATQSNGLDNTRLSLMIDYFEYLYDQQLQQQRQQSSQNPNSFDPTMVQ